MAAKYNFGVQGVPKNVNTSLFWDNFNSIPKMIAHVTTIICLEWNLSFKINFIWSKSATPIESYNYMKINPKIPLGPVLCVFL